jgi:hypothetical protein
MNVYLVSAGATLRQMGRGVGSGAMGEVEIINQVRIWDVCSDSIVGGNSAEEAQQRFETWLKTSQEKHIEVDIKRVVAAQFLDQLLTESGSTAIEWPRICQEATARLETTSLDDFEQGYWVDANEFIRPGQTIASVEALQGQLPEDVRSGLNWAPDKTFLFVVSILSPPRVQAEKPEALPMYEDAENAEDTGGTNPAEPLLALANLADKEAAVMVEARNSVVAAWLWQKFAAATPLAGKRILIGPWCGAVGIEGAP